MNINIKVRESTQYDSIEHFKHNDVIECKDGGYRYLIMGRFSDGSGQCSVLILTKDGYCMASVSELAKYYGSKRYRKIGEIQDLTIE